MEKSLIYKLSGAVLAVAMFSLAATVLAGTGAEQMVYMVGSFVLGWIGVPRPGDSRVDPLKAEDK